MTELNFQQKAEALNALAKIAILMRKANDWYISQSTEVKQGSMLAGLYGNGETPADAIYDHWQQLVTDLPPDQYIITNPGSDNRRAVKWNGYMWKEVAE